MSGFRMGVERVSTSMVTSPDSLIRWNVMTHRMFDGRAIQVIQFDDVTSDEHVIEFRDPDLSSTDSVIAVFNTGSDWSSARVSLSPRVESLSANFALWALGVAQDMIQEN
jgi:hypothetical protein